MVLCDWGQSGACDRCAAKCEAQVSPAVFCVRRPRGNDTSPRIQAADWSARMFLLHMDDAVRRNGEALDCRNGPPPLGYQPNGRIIQEGE